MPVRSCTVAFACGISASQAEGDVGDAELRRHLRYKAARHGARLIVADG